MSETGVFLAGLALFDSGIRIISVNPAADIETEKAKSAADA